MARETYRPPRLAERGVEIAVPIVEPEVWKERVRADPRLPASYPELRRLVGSDSEGACGESLWARIYEGLGNPRLDPMERDSIDSVLAEAMPAAWQTRPTPHFLLRWTDSDPNPAHNLDPGLIDEAEALLEEAWQALTATFGVEPFTVRPDGRIQVDFLDLPGVEGQAFPPDGPIQLDAEVWSNFPAKRAPLAAHELFHKLQYSFGFRVSWSQTGNSVKWFSEGTARWAEVFVYQRLTDAKWLTDWMADPRTHVLTSSFALPFWIFFDARLRSAAPTPLLSLLTACDHQQDARLGLDQVLGDAHQDLPGFFALFSAESWIGETRRLPNGQLLYPAILGPDGLPVDPRPAAALVRLDSGEVFQSAAVPVDPLGSCYHAISFAPGAEGRSLRLEARAGVDVAYTLLSLLAGRKVGEVSSVSAGFAHSQTVRLATADTLVLVASGRGTASAVEVGARVS